MSSGPTMTTRTTSACPGSPRPPLGHDPWSSYRAVPIGIRPGTRRMRSAPVRSADRCVFLRGLCLCNSAKAVPRNRGMSAHRSGRGRQAFSSVSPSPAQAILRGTTTPPPDRASGEPCPPTSKEPVGLRSGQPSMILTAGTPRPAKRRASQKWEPTCSAVPRPSAT
jgi:hypothetical protein